tara:strand:- start:1314 stop:1892 length:579 start_codon:yes stop_codon:yes gene_type:complete
MAHPSDLVHSSFGQHGSAFADTAANVVIAPENAVILAIQFLADTSFSKLVAEDPNAVINTASASHTDGKFTRQVDQSNSTTNKIAFDDTNAASGVAIGDKVFDSTGVLHGTVTALDPDGDNANEIQISASVAITNNEVLTFITPNQRTNEGVGGQAVDSSQVFPKGMTIYGRWLEASINGDDADGGIICYFG